MGWTPQTSTGFITLARPAVASISSNVFLAWLVDQEQHFLHITSDSDDTAIYYDFLGGESEGTIAQGTDGVVFGTLLGPAVTPLGSRIWMAWKGYGEDDSIWYSFYDPNSGRWTAQQQCVGSDGIVFATSDSPSVASFGTGGVMVWMGSDDDSRIWESTFDPMTNQWSPQKVLAGVDGIVFGTNERPTLVPFNGTLMLAWQGAGDDTNIWYSFLDPATGAWSAQTFAQSNGFVFGTSDGPALAVVGSTLLMAWKGIPGDNRIWYSTSPISTISWAPQSVAVGSDGVEFESYIGPVLLGAATTAQMFWCGYGRNRLFPVCQSTFTP